MQAAAFKGLDGSDSALRLCSQAPRPSFRHAVGIWLRKWQSRRKHAARHAVAERQRSGLHIPSAPAKPIRSHKLVSASSPILPTEGICMVVQPRCMSRVRSRIMMCTVWCVSAGSGSLAERGVAHSTMVTGLLMQDCTEPTDTDSDKDTSPQQSSANLELFREAKVAARLPDMTSRRAGAAPVSQPSAVAESEASASNAAPRPRAPQHTENRRLGISDPSSPNDGVSKLDLIDFCRLIGMCPVRGSLASPVMLALLTALVGALPV